MRLLHVGDIHLRDGVHMDDVVRCLDDVARIAVDREAHVILIPGDVFEHKSSPTERAAFLGWLQRLRDDWDGPVIICRGNHDYPGDLSVWLLGEGVYVYERPEMLTLDPRWGDGPAAAVFAYPAHPNAVSADAVDLMVIPWPEKAHLAALGHAGEEGDQAGSQALAHMVQTMAATRPDPDRPLVIIGHLSVVGATVSSGQPLIGREIQIGTAQLEETGAAYVALNHIHKHQMMTDRVVYAGSLTCHDFGEQDEIKGVVLVDVEPGEPARTAFVPVPAREWHTVDARVVDTTDGGRLVEESSERLGPIVDEAPGFAGANIRYRYRCTAEEQHLFDHAEIAERFAGAHTLKIVPEVERSERVRSVEVAQAATVEDKLRAWGQATETEITESLSSKLETLRSDVA